MTDPRHDGHLGSVYAGMAQAGYRHPSVCLALLARHLPRGAGPLLDAGVATGVGTGMIGDWLGIVGYSHVEGLDISEGMLAVAARKGDHRALHRAALGRRWRSRMAIFPGSCHPAFSPPGMSGPRCCRNCCASAGWAA